MNIAQIEESLRELVSKPFDASTFIFDVLAIYDAPKATITKLRQTHGKDLMGAVSVVWKRKLWFRSCPKGTCTQTLDAMVQDQALLKKEAPRILWVTDGTDVRAKDLKADQVLDTEFATLNDAFDFFLPLAGIERYEGVAENPADIKATGRLAKLYDAILESNPTWTQKEHTHALNLFMTRMLFCFFAEDTSIFEKGLFTQTVLTVSHEDGSDLHTVLGTLFDAMNRSDKDRADVPEWARRFPYVNGGLFKEKSQLPTFSRRARRLFKDCGELAWSSINPDIFGSMIQAIVEPGKRADMGMHYTSVPNIMKVLHPLFLLSLEEEFENARDSEAKLGKLLKRLHNIRVFDPACGSGNFLIIAYRELRKLENRIFVRLHQIGQRQLPMTGVQLNQFYGIELADFAAETAKLSLWIAEYQLNEQFKSEFGTAPAALPLRESGTIAHGNALRIDWLKFCPPQEEGETYLVGNPPYLGRSRQTDEQKEDMKICFSALTPKYKNLDYVACWTIKGAQYCSHTNAQCAFVTTNSICQGEQVGLLWNFVYACGIEIGFAHQSFKWRNNAAQNAGVTCVIAGLRRRQKAKKIIYADGLAAEAKNISPYLIDYDDLIVYKRSQPISNLPSMDFGSMPNDNGGLILYPEDYQKLIDEYPQAKAFTRQLYGSQEFINGSVRWCLWIEDDQLASAMKIPEVARRIEITRKHRNESTREETKNLAGTPHRFGEVRHQDEDQLIVPIHFSEDREYFTMGYSHGKDTVISNACYAVFNAPAYVFGLLSSRLHAVWITTVCGQLETRIRYSNTLGYNTFPVPTLSESQKQELEDCVWSIISIREAHAGKNLAWLYDAETMPKDILQAHRNLDACVERIYVGRNFKNDTERLEHLFRLYALMIKNEQEAKNKSLSFKGRK
jgi:hypothetical protein